MNTILIWLLVGYPAGLIAKFPDQDSCVAVHKQLEPKPWNYKCVPAKVFIGKEHT